MAIIAITLIVSSLAFLYGVYLMAFKKGRRKFGLKLFAASFVVSFVGTGALGFLQDREALAAGFASYIDQTEAVKFGITNGKDWAEQKDELQAEAERVAAVEAQEQADRDAAAVEAARANEVAALAEQKRVELEKQIEAEAAVAAQKVLNEKAAQDAEAKREARAAEEAENNRKGFHCLSAWDGSHRGFSRIVTNQLRDPDSFEHIETLVGPVNLEGFHSIIMKYRARNGFGGMNIEQAFGTFDNASCDAVFNGSE